MCIYGCILLYNTDVIIYKLNCTISIFTTFIILTCFVFWFDQNKLIKYADGRTVRHVWNWPQ